MIYLIAVNDGKEYDTLGDAMLNTNAVCNTVKKAFEIGLWMAGVAEPDHTYRKVADTIREKGIVFISEAGKPETCNIIITRIRKF